MIIFLVDAAITSIDERIEWATGPEYDELNDAIRDTELLLSAVVLLSSRMYVILNI